jgi:hypothetical protein
MCEFSSINTKNLEVDYLFLSVNSGKVGVKGFMHQISQICELCALFSFFLFCAVLLLFTHVVSRNQQCKNTKLRGWGTITQSVLYI